MKITEKRIRQLIRESLQIKILKESDKLPTGSDLKLLNDLATGSNASGSRNSQLDKVLSAIKKGEPGDLKKLLDQNPKIKTYSEKFPIKGKEKPNTTSERGLPTSPERMNKFADSLNKKMKNLKQLKASDEDKKNFQEFVDAVKKKDLKKAGDILSNHRDDFEAAFDNESEASSDFKRLRQGIRSSLGSGKKGGGSGARKTRKKPLEVIKDIQGMLNELGFEDYQGKKLDEDGLWGTRTRTASSKFLIDFAKEVEGINRYNEKNLDAPSFDDAAESGEDFYNFLTFNNNMINKLSTKPGKVGSWKKVALFALTDTENFLNNAKATGAAGLLTQTDGTGNSVKNAPEDLKHYYHLLFILNEYDEFKRAQEDGEEGEGEGEGEDKEEPKQRIEKSRQELVNNILTRVKGAPVLKNWLDRTTDYIYIDKDQLIKSRYLYNNIKSNLDTIKPINKTGREPSLKQRIVYLSKDSNNKTKSISYPPSDEGTKIRNQIIDKSQEGFNMIFFNIKFGNRYKYFVIPAK